jgi:hypothetical protein
VAEPVAEEVSYHLEYPFLAEKPLMVKLGADGTRVIWVSTSAQAQAGMLSSELSRSKSIRLEQRGHSKVCIGIRHCNHARYLP